jgi:hypothetical protein
MNFSTADLRNYWTEFHETWWSYIFMFLVGPKVFSFVVNGVKVIFWGAFLSHSPAPFPNPPPHPLFPPRTPPPPPL